MTQQRACAYRFQHPNRPGDVCGLPVDPACPCEPQDSLSPGPHCLWHCPAINKSPHDDIGRRRIRDALMQAVASGQYLEGAYLVGAHLEGAVLRSARLEAAKLQRAKLPKADLAEAHLEGAFLTGTRLHDARLWDGHLEGAVLDGAHAERAELGWARLEGARLWEAHLDGARLWRAGFSPETNCDETHWGVCGEERDGSWRGAEAVYRTVGHHYAKAGDYQRCDEFYFREMRMHHRGLVRDGLSPVAVDWTKGWWQGVVESIRLWRPYVGNHYAQARSSVRQALKRTLGSSRGLGGSLLCWTLGLPVMAVSLGTRSILTRVLSPKRVWGLWTRGVWAVHRLVWGYGIRPARTFVCMALTIVCCTLAFRLWLPVENAKGVQVLPVADLLDWRAWGLAFSVALDAFTTVGYGGYRPANGMGLLVAGLAGLAGVILAAAFIVALGTKYVRRAS